MNWELTGERIRKRWRKDTLREVYLRPDGTVLKRYWVKPGTRRYPKPWIKEHAALRRLAGESAPRTYGYVENVVNGGIEARFVRDYVPGKCLTEVTRKDIPDIARAFATIHGKMMVVDDSMIGNFAWDESGGLQCIDLGTARLFRFRSPFFYYLVGKEIERIACKLGGAESGEFKLFMERYRELQTLGTVARALCGLGFQTARITRYLRKESAPARFLGRIHRTRVGSVELRKKRYSGGKLLLRRGPDDVSVEDYVTHLKFLDTSGADCFATKNLQHRLYAFSMPDSGNRVVMKTFWPRAEYPLRRRINIWLHNLFGGEARRAFFGALKLEQAGIPSVRVLAYWTRRRSALAVEGYLIYEEIAAERTLRDVAVRAYGGDDAAAMTELSELMHPLARLVSALHAAGLSHDDLATGNFLLGRHSEDTPCLYLLDTERVGTRRVRLPVIKRALDLNDLRRLNLDENLRRSFMRLYLGEAYSEKWWKVLEFWRRGGNRPFRTAFRWATGRPDTAKKDGA